MVKSIVLDEFSSIEEEFWDMEALRLHPISSSLFIR